LTVAKELTKCKLELGGVQVGWEGGGIEPEGEYTFFIGKETRIMNYVQVYLCIRESYQQLRGLTLLIVSIRGRWCDIVVLNVHARKEEKIDDVKDSFNGYLERVFDKFHKHMIILLGDFNANVCREANSEPTY
jgi:hypothetical protein